MLLKLIAFLRDPTGRREVERLAQLRGNHSTWHVPLFGRKVQVAKRISDFDPMIGCVGQVLSEAEHGITRHPGWVEMTPNFGGIRGFHYLMLFGGKITIMSRDQVAPA